MSPPLLLLDSVSKRYWRGTTPIDVLNGASLELESGDFGAVWGARMSGKRTLLMVAAGIVRPDAGRVFFDGQDLARLSVGQRAKLLHFSIGFASRRGLDSDGMTISSWIAMGLMDRLGIRESERRTHAVLDRVGARDLGQATWSDLSDSGRTLVAIARAVVRGPKLLLVDNPAMGLNTLERDQIRELLRSLADDARMAVLMTAGEVGDTQGARPILSLSAGRLIGRSRPTATVVELPRRDASGRG